MKLSAVRMILGPMNVNQYLNNLEDVTFLFGF